MSEVDPELVEIQATIRFLREEALTLAKKRRSEIEGGRTRSPRESDKVLAGCVDCGMYIHAMDYMVQNELWESAGLDKKQFCCEDCLSIRVGRPLEIGDYTNAIINLSYFRGYEMARRNK
jgi:hypothetical protein